METATRKELRQFGLLTGTLFIVLLGWLNPWLRGHSYPVWPWAVGAVLFGAAEVYPTVLRWPFALWVAVGKLLGWINSRLILLALYYLMVTPMGLIMRATRRDPMARKFDPHAQSYRVPSRRTPIRNLERPF